MCSFASKVTAFKAGYDAMAGVSFGYLGNVDADETLAPDCFARLFSDASVPTIRSIAGDARCCSLKYSSKLSWISKEIEKMICAAPRISTTLLIGRRPSIYLHSVEKVHST